MVASKLRKETENDCPPAERQRADAPGMTRTEVGRELGLCRERVRQIEENALAKIRLCIKPEGATRTDRIAHARAVATVARIIAGAEADGCLIEVMVKSIRAEVLRAWAERE